MKRYKTRSVTRCQTRSITRSRLLELPLHLIYDILLRLTVDIIFKCKCVCKTFLDILTDPDFVELHLTKAPQCLIMQEQRTVSDLLLIYKYRFDLEKPGSDYDDSHPCQTVAVPTIASQFNKRSSNPRTVATCNGLLCLYYIDCSTRTRILYICNPVLGEFLALPPYTYTKFHQFHEYSDFGFCPKTKQYMVILFNCSTDRPHWEIYTLGTSSWREIGDLPLPFTVGSIGRCSVNGNLHWITNSDNISKFICSFSLETEQFSYISPPAHVNNKVVSNIIWIHLGLLDGLLCFSYLLGDQFEVFVMNDYGASGFWTKKLSFDYSRKFKSGNSHFFLINFLPNGEMFLRSLCGTVIFYNHRKGTTRQMLATKTYGRVTSFVPSLISLKNIMAEEAAGGHMEVVERTMGRNSWSENGFRFID